MRFLACIAKSRHLSSALTSFSESIVLVITDTWSNIWCGFDFATWHWLPLDVFCVVAITVNLKVEIDLVDIRSACILVLVCMSVFPMSTLTA